ncbi:hypothetical protein G7046_g7513 [Stylonectria norvegica]|nr:hypothetical protein G7046_g7513 [Stylonectria norvegica]
MIRVRCGAGHLASIVRLHGHPQRSWQTINSKHRLLSTGVTSSEPTTLPNPPAEKQTGPNEQAKEEKVDRKDEQKREKTRNARHDRFQVAQLRRQLKLSAARELAEGASPDKFNEALAVVRKVYGNKKSEDKPREQQTRSNDRKKKPKKQQNEPRHEPVIAETPTNSQLHSEPNPPKQRALPETRTEDSNSASVGLGQGMGIWTSLRDKLKQQFSAASANDALQDPAPFFQVQENVPSASLQEDEAQANPDVAPLVKRTSRPSRGQRIRARAAAKLLKDRLKDGSLEEPTETMGKLGNASSAKEQPPTKTNPSQDKPPTTKADSAPESLEPEKTLSKAPAARVESAKEIKPAKEIKSAKVAKSAKKTKPAKKESAKKESAKKAKSPAKNVNPPAKEGSTKKSKSPKNDIPVSKANSLKQAIEIPGKRKKMDPAVLAKEIVPHKLKLRPVEDDQTLEVPKLAYDLDRVLFNPGVYQLQDPRSRVYNFDPYLASIMPVEEFDYDALKAYVTSSEDQRLKKMSVKHAMKYCGSTSSMTAMLSHFHFLLSGWRPLSYKSLSRSFYSEHENFTAMTRGPAAAFARLGDDGVYAIDADKQFDTANVLSSLGKSMEKLLTLPTEEFEKYRRTRSHQLSDEEKNGEEAFHYTTFGDFMLRSQLDAHDPRLPGTGMFDLKTRAVVSIRMDVGAIEKGVGYEIRDRFGTWQSFEREYYDMIRSAFLKYSLQVRMGRMDGIFVAFHNTRRIFGFQYISLDEMDEALHGTNDRRVGDDEFKSSLCLLNEVLNKATERFPGKSLRLHVETRPTNPPLTYFFAEPVSDEKIEETQNTSKESMKELEEEIRGLSQQELEDESTGLGQEQKHAEEEQSEETDEVPAEEEQAEDSLSAWEELMAKVDETVESDALGLQSVRDAIKEALEQSGLLREKSEVESQSYLDALFEALSTELSGSKEVGESQEEVVVEGQAEETEQDIKEDSNDLFTAEVGVEAAITHPADGAPGETQEMPNPSTESASFVDASGNKPHEAQDYPDESVVVDDPSEATSSEGDGTEAPVTDDADGKSNDSSVSESSLKDLILKVAYESDRDTRDLRTFERVLYELAEESLLAEKEYQDEEAEDGMDEDVSSISTLDPQETIETPSTSSELFCAYITVRNKVNGKYEEQPLYSDGDKHSVQYKITELPAVRAWKIYDQIKGRRRKVLSTDPEQRNKVWHMLWRGELGKRSAAGEAYRKKADKEEAKAKKIRVAWNAKPIPLPKRKGRN